MHHEFTAVIEQYGKWYIAYCPEVPGASGHGKNINECKESLAAAISLILEERRQGHIPTIPHETLHEIVKSPALYARI